LNNPGFQAGDYEEQQKQGSSTPAEKAEKLHEPQNKRMIKAQMKMKLKAKAGINSA
jgi:hypothetical protein